MRKFFLHVILGVITIFFSIFTEASEITDSQGAALISSNESFDGTAVIELLTTPQTVEAIDMVLILTDAALCTGVNSGLRLNFFLYGHYGDGTRASVDTLMLDNTALLDVDLPGYLDASGTEVQMTIEIRAEDLQYSHISYIEKVRLNLSVTTDLVLGQDASAWFEFELPVDLRGIVTSSVELIQPVSVFEQDGLAFELHGFSDVAGELVCDLYLKNTSNMEKRIWEAGGSVDGVNLSCYIKLFKEGPFVLPPGSESWFHLHFFIYDYVDHKRVERLPSGLDGIHRIELRIKTEVDVLFDLP